MELGGTPVGCGLLWILPCWEGAAAEPLGEGLERLQPHGGEAGTGWAWPQERQEVRAAGLLWKSQQRPVVIPRCGPVAPALVSLGDGVLEDGGHVYS